MLQQKIVGTDPIVRLQEPAAAPLLDVVQRVARRALHDLQQVRLSVSTHELDGLEATRLIKAIDAIRDARVIAYTATTGLSIMPGGKLFAAVLEKRAPPDVVLEVVRYCATA